MFATLVLIDGLGLTAETIKKKERIKIMLTFVIAYGLGVLVGIISTAVFAHKVAADRDKSSRALVESIRSAQTINQYVIG